MKKFWMLVGIFLVATLGIAAFWLDFPNWVSLDVNRITQMNAASVMYDKDDREIAFLNGSETPVQISSNEIPDVARKAFVAAEDARFYSHGGIDLRRIFGAFLSDIKSMSLQEGASTITQQLVKLTHLSGVKTFARKANEAYLALRLEKQMSKEDILTAYMNKAYFGEGAYGIENAARIYFSKSAQNLDLPEAALLAGILKSPAGNNPFTHPENAAARREYVLERMAELGYITEDEANEARLAPLPERPARKADAGQWYSDQVISEACEKLSVRADDLFTGGYKIYTCFDPEAQANADRLYLNASNFPENAADGTPVQSAFCAIAPEDGAIRALVGGREYEVRRGLNRATQSRRQPGSTFKPISVYAAAVDALGLSPASILDDSPRTFAGGYTPVNAGGVYGGLVTLRSALSRSLNVASVSLIEFTGIDLARQYAMNAGIRLDESDNGLSLALGGLTYGVTPVELAAAYAPLANGGKSAQAHTIRKIVDRNGKTVYEFTPARRTVMSETSAYLITSMLKTAATEGSAKALAAAGTPIAGKTGTASAPVSGNRDIWTAAYTPDLVACVWMGFDETDETHLLPSGTGGSGYPARLLASFFKAEGEGRDFPVPPGVSRARIDRLSLENESRLLLAPDYAPDSLTLTEVFASGREPRAYSSAFDTPEKPACIHGEVSASGESRIRLISVSGAYEYVLFRNDSGGKTVVAVSSAPAGSEILFSDNMPGSFADYTVAARNRLMWENGAENLSTESDPITLVRASGFFAKIESLFPSRKND